MIWTVRTTVGREGVVISSLKTRAKSTGAAITALFHPAELRGYIFVEGEPAAIEQVIAGVPHVRGLIRKAVAISKLKHFLEVKPPEIKISRGDIIEVIGGPFKNERGKVTRVDTAKGEVTIELLEAAIPIPITVAMDSVRVIEAKKAKV